jgi:hypothetical protein
MVHELVPPIGGHEQTHTVMVVADLRIQLGTPDHHLRGCHAADVSCGNDLLVAVSSLIEIHQEVLRHVPEIGHDGASWTKRLVPGIRWHFVGNFLIVLAVGMRHIGGGFNGFVEVGAFEPPLP